MIKRSFKYTSLVLIGLFFIACIFFGTTFSGLKTIVTVLDDLIPGLKIELSSGALNRDIFIKSFTYHDSSIVINAENVDLHFRVLPLILNDLNVNKLNTDSLSIKSLPSKTSSNNTPLDIQLPLKIFLDSVKIKAFHYQQAQQDYQINNIELQGEVRSNKAVFSQLSANYQDNNYQLTGHINLRPINVDLSLKQQQHNKTTLQAAVTAHGNWQKMKVQASTTEPIMLSAQGEIDNLLNKPAWSMTGKINKLNIGLENNNYYTAEINGHGDTNTLILNSILMPSNNTNFSQLHVQLQSNNLAKEEFRATLDWQNLFWPAEKHPTIFSPIGSLNIAGKLDHYQVNGTTTLFSHEVPHIALTLNGNGNTTSINLNKILINTLNGTITGNAKFNWKKQFNYIATLQANKLQPSVKWVNFPGALSFNTEVKTLNEHTTLQINNISGKLRQESLQGNISANFKNYQLSTAAINLSTNDSRVMINASNQHNLNVDWNITIPQLERFTPLAYGKINSQGSYRAKQNHFLVDGNLSLAQVNWQDSQVGTLNSTFAFNSDANKKSIISLDASHINVRNYAFAKLALNINGIGSEHNVNLLINNNADSLDTSFTVHLNSKNQHWVTKVNRLNLDANNLGFWQLHQPFNIESNAGFFKISGFKWHSKQQNLNADLLIKNKILQSAKININNFSLATFNFALPDTFDLFGKLNIRADYQSEKNAINANVIAKLIGGKINYTIKDRKEEMQINQGVLSANIDNNKLSSELKLQLQDTNYLNLQLNMPRFSLKNFLSPNTIIQGKLNSKINTLSFLKPFIPAADNLQGKFAANLRWDGTLYQPNLIGNASFTDAQLFISNQGIKINAVNLMINALNQQVSYLLNANSGNGKLQVNGTSYLTNNYHTDLNITGKNFVIDNTPNFHVVVSPDLTIHLKKQRIDVDGSLLIPTALINLNSYNDVTTLPSDVQIVKATGAETQASLLDHLYASINLQLGNEVELKSKILTAALTGNIKLNDSPKRETNATGELVISQGTVTVFGQKLSINNGKLFYAGGATTNPGLNIKATKQIKTFVNPAEDSLTQNSLSTSNNNVAQNVNVPLQQKTITVGVSVTGTLEQPVIMLYSDQPDLSQADILSYLILGYPLSKASNQEGEALIQAANALSSSDSEMGSIINKLKDTFDLNEIGLQSTNYLNPNSNTVEQNTSLVLGKMLSPKLFVRYSIGLLIPINTLSATYSFSDNWSLQTETNSLGNGVDLIYSWENN
jgi:translocation and assembly module TamB